MVRAEVSLPATHHCYVAEVAPSACQPIVSATTGEPVTPAPNGNSARIDISPSAITKRAMSTSVSVTAERRFIRLSFDPGSDARGAAVLGEAERVPNSCRWQFQLRIIHGMGGDQAGARVDG